MPGSKKWEKLEIKPATKQDIKKSARVVILFSHKEDLYTIFVEQFWPDKRPWEKNHNPKEVKDIDRFATWTINHDIPKIQINNKLSYIWGKKETQTREEAALREIEEEANIQNHEAKTIIEIPKIFWRTSGHKPNRMLLNKFFVSNLGEIDKNRIFKPQEQFYNEIKRVVTIPIGKKNQPNLSKVSEYLKHKADKVFREEFITPFIKKNLLEILNK